MYYRYTYEIYPEELSHPIVEVQVQNLQQPESSGCCSSSLKTICRQNSFSLRGGQSLFYERPSSDWRRPAHIMEGHLLTQNPLI